MTNRTVWTDEELDLALAALHSEVDEDRDLSHTKELLLAGPRAKPTGHRVRVLAAAAAAVAVVAGLVVVQAIPFRSTDQTAAPVRYHHVRVDMWTVSTGHMLPVPNGQKNPRCWYRYEQVFEQWNPVDSSKPMPWRQVDTGNYVWLSGPPGPRPECPPPPERDENGNQNPPSPIVGWEDPTTEWVAALPRDPQRLYDRLRADVRNYPGQDPSSVDVVMFSEASKFLHRGLAPADLRAALRQVLSMIPGVRVTDNVTMRDGRQGTAYGSDIGGVIRDEIIIDPVTAQLIGDRWIELTDRYVPAGTVFQETSVIIEEVSTAPDIHPKPSTTARPSR